MGQMLNLTLNSIKQYLPPVPIVVLVLTIAFYALFGSPTPDNLGKTEAIMALGLILSVGITGARSAIAPLFDKKILEPLWVRSSRLLLLYGVGVGLFAGAIGGNSQALIARDLVAFCLLMLPLFVWPHISTCPLKTSPALLFGACFIGVVFAARTLNIVPFLHSQDLFYLANAPTVLFTALFLVGMAATVMIRGRRGDMAIGAVIAAFAFIPTLALISNLQRASFGALVLGSAIIGASLILRNPKRGFVLLAIFAVLVLIVAPSAAHFLEELSRKSQEVGLNRRLDELAAVWKTISAHPLTFLFGIGWGGTFASPAVGGVSVNFTHSLLSGALLKMGVVGLGLVAFYLASLAAWCARILPIAPAFAMAIAAPMAIDTFLYASYKSLDFGIVLTLIPAGYLYLRAQRPA